jgi:hypothetical protein
MRDAEGFLTRESWEQDLRAARSQAAVEDRAEQMRMLALEDVELAFKRAHRRKPVPQDDWQLLHRWYKQKTKRFLEALEMVRQEAYSRPITEDDWQRELKRREKAKAKQ